MVIKKSIVKLFEKAGDVGPQPNLLKMLKDKFLDMSWAEFSVLFMDATMSVIVTQTTIHCVTVNNMIKFAANGLSVLSEYSTKDGRSGLYLISEFFQLCRKYGNANDKAIRWRFCLFLNHLLNHMTEGTVLSVELCDVATMLLLDRLQDKKPEVRAQAAHALNLLQTPDNPKCPVVKKFMFHMTCDSSVEVRTVIVKKIAMFNNVIDEMMKNTLFDVSDNVRREAYNRFLEYPFLRLSSKQRQTLLEIGLEDKNESIRSLVKKRFLERWLDACNNDFVVLLNNLGVDNEIVCEKALNIIFETYYDSQVLDFINEYLNSDSRMIAFDKLSVEKIFLWKCIAKYLTTEKKIELARNQGHVEDYYVDVLLPDLVKFSDYIRDYYFNSMNSNEFILIQLLDMTSAFAMDDVGAESLNKLCLDLILDDQLSVKPIKSVAVLFGLTFKNGKDLLNYVKQILNKIQTRTIDIYPLIDKVGTKELLEFQVKSQTDKIEELLKNESPDTKEIEMLILKLKKLKKQYKEINVLPEEKILVDMAVKNVLKVFELVFQVQQLPKVGIELSLLTDIVQNIVVGYLECSKVNVRMEAIRSLSPYLLVNNVPAAKVHMNTLCSEIARPMTDRHLLFKIMFELFMRYDLKTFDMNDDLDTDEEYEDDFSVDNILPLLVNCIDYNVDDSSFKSVVVKGFCDLLIFKKVKSINLLSKLLLIWFKRLSRETFSIYNHLVKFFTSYVFYIDSSSSALAMCYVPVLKEIYEYNLAEKLGIKIDEVNSTLMNLTRGLMYKNEKKAINAHGELACYILDYLLDENQPFTAMLVDTLYKLEIDFDNNDKLVNTIGPKLLRVIKYLKHSDDKNSSKYLKKIKNKFDPVLQKKESFMKKMNEKKVDATEKEVDVTKKEVDVTEKEVDATETETEKEQTQGPSTVNNEPDMVEVHEDLFTQENLIIMSSDDEDDSIEGFQTTKLDAMKRLSEVFKRSFNANTYELTSDDSD
ncbi:condensin complex subunit 3 [Acyrthosiphon pisum]|uniref:Nuclear condensin complex subunit 3 C-terminal domain-containing protein n=1 Tax=Acyrthosiphon pisum TaxID=7029 RepID=A0A8R2JNS5_ACYPI|nr:condensin complex subunit 3 [Acyrthosiphon pisum]